jgi:hemoglobin
MNAPHSPATEQHIAELVRTFYARARADEDLRPIFETAIHDWAEHLRIVEDFWSRTLLGTNRYKGSPYAAHVFLPLRPEHFDRWLALFREAARETLPLAAAEQAIGRAEHMAESFKAGMFTLGGPVVPRRGRPAE